jgi:hypothetical protein
LRAQTRILGFALPPAMLIRRASLRRTSECWNRPVSQPSWAASPRTSIGLPFRATKPVSVRSAPLHCRGTRCVALHLSWRAAGAAVSWGAAREPQNLARTTPDLPMKSRGARHELREDTGPEGLPDVMNPGTGTFTPRPQHAGTRPRRSTRSRAVPRSPSGPRRRGFHSGA